MPAPRRSSASVDDPDRPVMSRMSNAERPDALTLVAFGVLVVLAGGNAVGIKIIADELAAFWGAGVRFAAAGLIFAALMLALRVPIPRGPALVGAILYGLLGFGAGFGIAFVAIPMTGAGTAQVLLGLAPLLTLILVPLHGLERFRPRAFIGSLVALVGVATLAADRIALEIPPEGIALALVVALLFAEAGVVAKMTPGAHPIATNAVGMLAGAALLFPVSLLAGEGWVLPRQADTWAAVAYLVLAGSVVVFWLFIFVVRRWAASAVSFQFLLIPLATIPFSALLTGEAITPLMLVGGAVVLLGVYVGAFAPTLGRRTARVGT
jgi:drug/metabolite transporter (DMT)-like permease